MQALAATQPREGESNWDRFRRDCYQRVSERTGRPLVIYASAFLHSKPAAAGGLLSISLADRDGLIEVTRDVTGDAVDVLVHSPGGSAEAADSLVHILRGKFKHVRFLVPGVAKSAATMMVLAGDELCMDRNAEVGPIDPQLVLTKADGTVVSAPAQAIIDQFDAAQDLLSQEPKKLPAWIPILQQYGPALYKQCKNAIALSKEYAGRYLRTYLLAGRADADGIAKGVVEYLADHNSFLTHGARIGIEELRAKGLEVKLPNDDPDLADLIENVMHALSFTFDQTPVVKLFENSEGHCLLRFSQVASVPVRLVQAPAPSA